MLKSRSAFQSIVYVTMPSFELCLLGIFDTTATGKLNILDWWGEVNLENSLRWRAGDNGIPAGTDPAEGFEHYLTMCLHCHGGPGVERQE